MMHARTVRTLLGPVALCVVGCLGRSGGLSQPVPDTGTVMATTAVASGPRTLVAGDLLDITVFAAPELSRETRVGDDGSVTMPLVGVVHAAGRTPQELATALQDTLRRTYMLDPRVAVEVKEAATAPVYVVGEVNQPGAFTQAGESRLTVLRAVALARGLKPNAAYRAAVVLRPSGRGEPARIPVNLDDAVRGRAPDLVLQPNDVLFVPTNTQRAVTLGMIDAALRLVTFRAVF